MRKIALLLCGIIVCAFNVQAQEIEDIVVPSGFKIQTDTTMACTADFPLLMPATELGAIDENDSAKFEAKMKKYVKGNEGIMMMDVEREGKLVFRFNTYLVDKVATIGTFFIYDTEGNLVAESKQTSKEQTRENVRIRYYYKEGKRISSAKKVTMFANFKDGVYVNKTHKFTYKNSTDNQMLEITYDPKKMLVINRKGKDGNVAKTTHLAKDKDIKKMLDNTIANLKNSIKEVDWDWFWKE